MKIRRLVTVPVATGAALLLAASPALAHDCFVTTGSTSGAGNDAKWHTIVVSEMFGSCDAQVDAIEAALRDAKLPQSIKVRIDKHLLAGTGAEANGKTVDGKGIDNFADGSPLPDEMLGVAFAAIAVTPCEVAPA